MTEDINGTSAHMAIEFSGADSDVLLGLVRKAEALLKKVPGTVDVNNEQEGPPPRPGEPKAIGGGPPFHILALLGSGRMGWLHRSS